MITRGGPSSVLLLLYSRGSRQVPVALFIMTILSLSCAVRGQEYTRYRNAAYGLHFECLPDWTVVVEDADLDVEGDLWVSIAPLGDANTRTRPILDLIVNPGSEGDVSSSGLLSYAEKRVDQRVVGSFMVVSSEEAVVAGRPAREMAILYQFAVGPGEDVSPLTFTEKVVFWEKDGNFYELSCRAVSEEVPGCEEALDLAKRTFAFQ